MNNGILNILLSVSLSSDSDTFWILALCAVIPVILLIVFLGFLKMAGHKSALLTLVATLAIAVLVFKFQ